jgi:site-specific DNA-methyltransferase (adenine-specific)
MQGTVIPQHNMLLFGDNLAWMRQLPSEFFRLAYIDPPFNTGKLQKRERIRVFPSPHGNRRGFADRRYEVVRLPSSEFADAFDDYLGFLEPRLSK